MKIKNDPKYQIGSLIAMFYKMSIFPHSQPMATRAFVLSRSVRFA